MANKSENLDARLDLLTSSDWVKEIDEWRKRQPKIISRNKAIRVLVIKGLETETDPKRKP